MVIRSYHWLNSAIRVLISTCSAPLVQTGERKQFSLFGLDLWPTTLTYNTRLAEVKVDTRAKNQGQRSNGSNRRAPTDKRTDGRYQRIVAPATRSIISKIDNTNHHLSHWHYGTDWRSATPYVKTMTCLLLLYICWKLASFGVYETGCVQQASISRPTRVSLTIFTRKLHR